MPPTKPRKSREAFGTLGKQGNKYYPTYPAPDGKRYKSPTSYSNITQARAWLAGQRAAIEAGEWSPSTAQEIAGKFVPARGKAVEFKSYALDLIRRTRTNKGMPLAVRTSQEYERLVEKTLTTFHGRDLRYITAEDVNTWWDDALDYGAHTQASHAYDRLRATMRDALDKKLIGTNPVNIPGASSVRTGKKVRRPSDSDVEAVLAGLPLWWRALFVCEAWGGLRYGEVTELRARDIELGQRIAADYQSLIPTAKIHVSRAVVWTKESGAIVKAPKSEAGIRTVPVSTRAAAVLKEFLESGHSPASQDDLLWTALAGNGHLRYSVYWRHWSAAVTAAGVEYFTPHGLRHYAATLYAQAGATLAELQAIVGHSTAQAAMRYQHAAQDRLTELADKADQVAVDGVARQKRIAELQAQAAAAAAELAALGA